MNHYFKLSLLFVLSLLTLSLAPAPREPLFTSGLKSNGNGETPSGLRMQTDWGKMPLYFIANLGQMDDQVSYYVQGRDKTLYFTSHGVTFALTGLANSRSPVRRGRISKPFYYQGKDGMRGRWTFELDFVGANPVRPVGKEQTDVIISYFKGQPEHWKAGLPTYSQIVYHDLWEGIDLVYSGTVDRSKYEFVVQPGVDPERIRLAYRGASAWVNQAGQLEVRTPRGGFHDDAPVAYQEVYGRRLPVTVAYALENANQYGFQVGVYDPELPLVIDPAMLVYCGYIGGNGGEVGNDIAVNSAGNAYVTGITNSTWMDFPTSIGPDRGIDDTDTDAAVVKVKTDGMGFVYLAIFGGTAIDYSEAIALDPAGNAYITGWTESDETSFPVLIGPDLTYNDHYDIYGDAFVAKVNATGTGLMYAGYIGGAQRDHGMGIAVNATGNAFVTGNVRSLEDEYEDPFPVIVGPDLTHNGGWEDAFVAKVETDGSGLIYCGYIGSEGLDWGQDIALDSTGSAYVVGWTEDPGDTFPVIVGPDLTYNGPTDAFITKVSPSGAGLVYSGFIGGSGNDGAESVVVDSAGNAYVTGDTDSTEASFPVSVGPDLTFNGGYNDAFVAKVKADGTGFVFAGYIGGNNIDYGQGIALDTERNVYVAGSTSSNETTFPVKIGPDITYNDQNGIQQDAFIARVKANGDDLDYCGYIGGAAHDHARGIAVDSEGYAYVAGDTESNELSFPVRGGPDVTYNNGDAFVAKAFRFSDMPFFWLNLPIIKRY